MSVTFKESGLDEFVKGPTCCSRVVYNDGSTQVKNCNTFNYEYRYSYCRGVSNPGFFKKVRSGSLVGFTPWEQFVGESRLAQASFSYSDPNWGTETKDPGWNPFDNRTPDLNSFWSIRPEEVREIASSLVYEAGSLLQQAASSAYSDGFDVLTFAAEWTKTVAMLRKFVVRLVKLLRDPDFRAQIARQANVAVRDARSFWRYSKRYAKEWLELRYGWRTLLYDMQDINRAIERLGADERLRIIKRQASSGVISTDVRTHTFAWFGGTLEVLSTSQISLSARGTFAAKASVSPILQVNPVVTGWELITFSFVIDWVFSVGSALKAMSAVALASESTGCTGIQVLVEREPSMGSIVPYGGTSLSMAVSGKAFAEYVIRSPGDPSYAPRLNLNLSLTKLADLLALLRVAMK